MYIKSLACFNVSQFHTLLWKNEYEFQFCLHNDVEHTCAKMQHAMVASVHPLVIIKFHHSCGSKLKLSIGGC